MSAWIWALEGASAARPWKMLACAACWYTQFSFWLAERHGPPTACPQHKASARVIVVPLMFSLGIRALLDHLASTLSQRLILAYLDDIYTHGLCFLRPRHTSGIVVPQTGLDTRRYASVRALDCGKA
jgi:hypothetical protein